MINLFCTHDGKISEVSEISDGVWIKITSPTSAEIKKISVLLGIEEADVSAAIDPEEKNRVENRENYTLVLADIPIEHIYRKKEIYKTIPIGIIITKKNVITICAESTQILDNFHNPNSNIRNFSTKKEIQFLCRVMLQISLVYQEALTAINKKRIDFEEHMLSNLTDESDLITIHALESSLVYFTTSLKGNNNVLDKIYRSNRLIELPEDRELLYDVITENQQAIEMAQIYREIINGTREFVSSVLNSRLNNVMKRLTSITLLLSIPTVISGMYGMNVDQEWMPLAHTIHGFGIIGIFTVIICAVLTIILKNKKML